MRRWTSSLILVAFFSGSLFAQQVAVTDTSSGTADGATLDITHIVATGEVLICAVVLEVTDSAKEVGDINWDDGGGDEEPLVRFTDFVPSHGKLRIEIWSLGTPAPKTATVQITIENANSQKMGAVCLSTTNTDTGTPLALGDGGQDGTGSTGSVTATQGANDLAAVFAGHLQSSDNFSPGGGETEHEDFLCQSFFVWGASEDATGATTLSWTQTQSKERSTFPVVIKEVGAAAAVPRRREVVFD